MKVTHCPQCHEVRAIVEEFNDQRGIGKRSRFVRVMVLSCGHEIVDAL